MVNQADKKLPLFLMGNGLGAFSLITFLIQNLNLSIAGVFFISPIYKIKRLKKQEKSWKEYFLNMIHVQSNDDFNYKFNPSAIVKDPYHLKKLIEFKGQLISHTIKQSMFQSLLSAE